MSEVPGVPATNHIRQVHTPDGLDVGHIRYESLDILSVAPGATGVIPVDWPYNVGISSGALLCVVDAATGEPAGTIDDEVTVYGDTIHPSLVLAQNADQNDTVVYLPVEVLLAIQLSVGDFLCFDASEPGSEEGHIINIDRETGAVTLQTGLNAAYAAGTVIHRHRYFVGRKDKPYRVVPHHVRKWGEDTFDSALLPAGTPLRMTFKNGDDPQAQDAKTKHALGEISILYGDDVPT